MNLAIKKYLEKKASNNWSVEWDMRDAPEMAIVIPTLDEYDGVIKLLLSLAENESDYFQKTLIIFVVNNPEDANQNILRENIRTAETLRRIILKRPQTSIEEKIANSNLRLALVDAFSESRALPLKEAGVGLARKAGMDISLNLFDHNTAKKKIIVCLDADCAVSKNYISSIYELFNERNISAAAIKFEHNLNEAGENIEAIICYELFLRYYVLGLTYAGSPYAYHTVGSSMACDSETYVKAGGMNKKKAAEDFYFLEKLGKIVEVKNIKEALVYPSSRASWRVPFGTGQRVNRYNSKTQNEYLLYSPQSFEILKSWLDLFLQNDLSAELFMKEANNINPALGEFLKINEFSASWTQIKKNAKTKEQLNKQKKNWFDGFRTLKLIHYLRDNGYPLVFSFKALDDMLIKMKNHVLPKRESVLPPVGIQIDYLSMLRKMQ